MLIAVFIDKKTNKIKNHQKMPENWTKKEADEHSRAYNQKDYECFSKIILVKKDSVLEYLLTALEQKVRYTKETIEDALSALREAEDAINSLQVAEKE